MLTLPLDEAEQPPAASPAPCRECAAAAAGPAHGFDNRCKGCRARAAARSPFFADSLKAGRLTTDYRTLIDRVGVTHDEVKAAAAADRLTSKGK